MHREYICNKCYKSVDIDGNRIVCGPADDSYCDCVHNDDPYENEMAGWPCDWCKNKTCPMVLHEVLYIDKKLPHPIQVEIQLSVKYRPGSEGFIEAQNNFTSLNNN